MTKNTVTNSLKTRAVSLFSVLVLTVCLTACGWTPKVSAVPLTAEWSAMNLPVKENAVVWKSEAKELRAVHKEDKQTVARKYIDALKAQGWESGKFDSSGDRYTLDMRKGAEQLHLEFYDFDNTGVVIEKK